MPKKIIKKIKAKKTKKINVKKKIEKRITKRKESQIIAKAQKKESEEYKAEKITVLEGLNPVRKRPAMYIGTTDLEGLHHLIWEVVDNGIDEAMVGYCNEIKVELLLDNMIRVSDNGRGIPVDLHKPTKKSALEVVMTKLHAGAKFSQAAYKVAGGLHGVGISVVNALSIYLKAEVHRVGKIWMQEYKRGKPLKKVRAVGKTKERGTVITFQPDPEIFPKIEFDWQKILDHLRQQAYLTKGIKIIVTDDRQQTTDNRRQTTDDRQQSLIVSRQSYVFYFEGGIKSYVRHLNRNLASKQENIFYLEKEESGIHPVRKEDDSSQLSQGKSINTNRDKVSSKIDFSNGVKVEIAFQYTDEYKETVFAFANNIYNPEGGTHLIGFRTALTRTLNNFSRKQGYLKEKDENLIGEDVREGLTAVISVKVREPQFEGQTKAKLGNAEVRPIVESVFSEALQVFLEENPKEAEAIIGKCLLTSRARQAAKSARETVLRKGVLEGLTLPGKLADCSSRDAKKSELYIVEGDSAGGCLDGDTKIALVDGRNINFKELIEEDKKGKRNYCYTINEDGTIGIGLIENPRKTKENAEVIKIILDNNEELICTPDHKFMMRDGGYVKAEDLKNDISIMSVKNYNHKIKKVIKLNQKIDVYDLEIKGTHNFALAAGVFIHNSAKQGRDRFFQAILPLRGKILNVERTHLDKMLANNEIKSLIIALGTNIGEQFNIDDLRYHRVIIMTDADVDGSHIRTLLLTLFYRYFLEIITKGYLYIAQPPLYRIQKGKEVVYAYTDEEKVTKLRNYESTKVRKNYESTKERKEIDEEVEKISAVGIQRYKGLGEMNPSQLWETTMDPQTRLMKQVTIEDAEKADEIFEILMGHEVSPRKRFIQTHAKSVRNLDI